MVQFQNDCQRMFCFEAARDACTSHLFDFGASSKCRGANWHQYSVWQPLSCQRMPLLGEDPDEADGLCPRADGYKPSRGKNKKSNVDAKTKSAGCLGEVEGAFIFLCFA